MMWKSLAVAGLTLSAAVLLPTAGLAQPAGAPACTATVQAMLAQEDKDRTLLMPIAAEARVRGMPAINAHLDELKVIVDRAPAAEIPECDGQRYVRGAGPAGVLGALAAAAPAAKAGGSNVKVVALAPSPYVTAALYAGSAYVARGAWAEADRVMARGLALDPGSTMLATEDSLALSHLGRNEQALAVCERILARGDLLPVQDHARLLRARGYILGELGRFDDAIADYQQSLVLIPGNGLALNEIAYLTRRKAGGGKLDPATILSKDSQAVKPPQ